MDVLYIDELFALNLLADYLLLLAAARLRGLPLRRGRCALAALLGALYACAAVLPALAWLNGLAVKLALSGLMALIAYGGDEGLARSWGCFAAVAAAFAGAVTAAALLSGTTPARVGLLRVPLKTLLLSFGLFYALLRVLLERVLVKRERPRLAVAVTLGERRAAFTALRDTGNTLCDPVTGRRVLIAERAALAPLFPDGLPEGADAAAALRALAQPGGGNAARFRLVPYRAVGGGGLLLCFRPDALELDGTADSALVALAPAPFAEGAEYQAII